MSRLFDDASSQYLEYAAAIVPTYPFSVSCWFYADADVNGLTVWSLGDIGSLSQYWHLFLTDSAGGSVVRLNSRSGTSKTCSTTASYSLNTWHLASISCPSANLQSVYLDGGNKGTNVTATSPFNPNRTRIGQIVRSGASAYFSGMLAECGMWDVALTDDEMLVLGKGYSPRMVRPGSLIAYWPIFGRVSPEMDVLGDYPMTLNNGPSVAAHTRMFYPFSSLAIPATTAAPPVGGANLFMPSYRRRRVT